MTDYMSIEELHEYQSTGRLPQRLKAPTRSETLLQVATASPDVLDAAAARKVNTNPTAKTDLEAYLVHGGFGRVESEFRFHPTRQWRADYALLDQDPVVLVEYDGLMQKGANASHASIGGILRDSEKANAATALGFRCFRANAKTIHDGSFMMLMDEVLEMVS